MPEICLLDNNRGMGLSCLEKLKLDPHVLLFWSDSGRQKGQLQIKATSTKMRINGTRNIRNETTIDLHELEIYVWAYQFLCLSIWIIYEFYIVTCCEIKYPKIIRLTIGHAVVSSPPVSLPYKTILNSMAKRDFSYRTSALFSTLGK